METIYENHETAMGHAWGYMGLHKGVALLDYPETAQDIFEDGHFIGTYPCIVVVLEGMITKENPFGDSWETFYYEP